MKRAHFILININTYLSERYGFTLYYISLHKPFNHVAVQSF